MASNDQREVLVDYGTMDADGEAHPATLRASSIRASGVRASGVRASGRMSQSRASALATRTSAAIRRSLSTAVHAVGEKIERGTILGTTFNTLCNIVGAGMLSLPLAMHNATIWPGIAVALLTGIGAAFAIYALSVGCERTGKGTMFDVLAWALYPDPCSRSKTLKAEVAAESSKQQVQDSTNAVIPLLASAPSGQVRKRALVAVIVRIIVLLYNFGTLAVFGRVIADSIPPVIEDFLHLSGLWTKSYTWLGFAGVIFFFLTCARKMEELKWTSLLGFITIFYVAVMVVVRYFTNKSHKFVHDPKSEDVRWLGFGIGLFQCVASLGVAYGYHYNAPIFYSELKNKSPKRMMMTVALAYPLIISSYLAVGILGYLTFGALVADGDAGGDVVNNYPDDDIPINIGRLGLFLHFVFVYPILSVGVRRNLHNIACRIKAAWKGQPAPETTDDGPKNSILRLEAFLLVSTNVVVAYFVPGIGLVIQVIGALFGSLIVLVIPGIVGSCVFNRSGPVSPEDGMQVPRRSIPFFVSIVLIFCGITINISGIVALVLRLKDQF